MARTPPRPESLPNLNTVVSTGWAPPALGRVQAGLELALQTLRGSVLGAPSRAGVHVFGVFGQTVLVRFVPVGRVDAHLVIGRHAGCDMQLSADPSISLRHLLARATALADGTIGLRLLDLGTGVPMTLADGTVQRSLVATGPFAVGLGPYVLGGIPHDLARYVTAPPRGGASAGGPYRAPPPLVERAARMPRAGLRTSGGRRSRITLLPGSELVTQLPRQERRACGRLTLSRASGEVTSLEIDAPRLEQGVLIGRAERCLGEGARALMTMSISRVHLMLLRDGERTLALDLSSTQGVYENGRRQRAVDLTGRTAALSLGQYEAVQLVWQPYG